MTRERHIYELERLISFGESMCPASKQYWKEHKDEVLEAVKNTKEGEWIPRYHQGVDKLICECSNCHTLHVITNYCPNCGADNRPKLAGKHADQIIIDEAVADMRGR